MLFILGVLVKFMFLFYYMFFLGKMEVDNVVNIAVFYDGSWVKKDNGFKKFQNYHRTIIGINKRCTFEKLEGVIYRSIRRYRNEQYLNTTF